jgi:hypothetical protein
VSFTASISASVNRRGKACREKANEWKSNSAAMHQSKGIDMTRKRLIDFNEDDSVAPIEFIDLYDDEKNLAGTQVIVRIKRKFNFISV